MAEGLPYSNTTVDLSVRQTLIVTQFLCQMVMFKNGLLQLLPDRV
jgi:hypothetical protein